MNRFVSAHSWMDPKDDTGTAHEHLSPPTTNSLASIEINSRSKLRTQNENGIVVLKEAIDSITEIQMKI
jgi:hypothetical protein